MLDKIAEDLSNQILMQAMEKAAFAQAFIPAVGGALGNAGRVAANGLKSWGSKAKTWGVSRGAGMAPKQTQSMANAAPKPTPITDPAQMLGTGQFKPSSNQMAPMGNFGPNWTYGGMGGYANPNVSQKPASKMPRMGDRVKKGLIGGSLFAGGLEVGKQTEQSKQNKYNQQLSVTAGYDAFQSMMTKHASHLNEDILKEAANTLIDSMIQKQAAVETMAESKIIAESSEKALNNIGYSMFV